ncbi:MAG: hypothetical protein V3T33_09650 [Myxococcota bacterium]
MSTILKALRQLEAERSRPTSRDPIAALSEVPLQRRDRVRGLSLWLLVLLAVGGAAAVGLVVLLRSSPDLGPPGVDGAGPPPEPPRIEAEVVSAPVAVVAAVRPESPPPPPTPAVAQVPGPLPAEVIDSPGGPIAAQETTSQGFGDPVSDSIAAVSPVAPAPEAVLMVPRQPIPDLTVTHTVWHPEPARRVALLELAGSAAPLELREGDAVGPLILVEIAPSGVTFLHNGVELRRRVGTGR